MANKKENPNRHEISIVIEGENWDKAVEKAFLQVQKKAQVDGFRKGHVPKSIYDKKFGQDYLIDAVNEVISDEFKRIMEENKFELVADPQVHITSLTDQKAEVTITLIEQPAIHIKKYKGLGIKKDKVEVSDEEVEHELSHLLERYSELVVKEDGVVENGDVAIIDFEGFIDGVPFDGGKAENYSLEIGSGSFIPGFEEQIVGMKQGEEKEISVTFPEDYPEESIQGKAAIFKVKVNDIKVKKTREMDDEFFEDLGIEGVQSEEALREKIHKSIETQKERDAENKYVNDLIEAVSKEAEVDIPEEMVFDVVERMLDDLKKRMEMQGIRFATYLEFTHKTEEDIRNEMEHEAFARVLARLTLEEIQKLENITVDDEEVDARIKEFMDKYKMTEEDVFKEIGTKWMIKYDLEMNKVIDFLKNENK